jgi:uncharacterized protein YjbI with pentapeptide repeats
MSDSITALTRFAIRGLNDARSLKTYNGSGLSSTGTTSSGNPRDFVADQVTLSTEARRVIATANGFFPEREAGLNAVTNGETFFNDQDLSGASFVGQILDGAVFNNSNLTGVNFVGASLRGTIFSASVVDGARFNQANLSGADLTGAKGLVFSQLQGAITDTFTVLPTGIGNRILG